MKKYAPVSFIFATIVYMAFLLPGCSKHTCTYTYRISTPVYKTNAEVRANIKSNPAKKIITPGKIFVLGNHIFLNETNRGVHIIDNTNPAAPRNVAFIDIPGNMDIAVKGNVLYADLYTDLVAMDISNPLHTVTKKIIDNAFPERRYTNGFMADTGKIVVDWITKDTTVKEDCDGGFGRWGCPNCQVAISTLSSSSPSMSVSPTGTGGSMARFAIVDASLYTVGTSNLSVYSIASEANPVFANKLNLGWGIETIYPFKEKLFIGSSSGMFIYDIKDPNNPSKLSQFSHLTACDPVIADDQYAFVTLSSGTRCSNASNQLDILDISNLSAPFLVKTYGMTNPRGLSKDGNTLFICDGKDGLKIYDAANVSNISLINHIKGFESYDILTMNKLAILVTKDGLRQYDYTDPKDIKLLSTMGWE